jgi:hypothetical protein
MRLRDRTIGASILLNPRDVDEGLLEPLVVVVAIDSGSLEVSLGAEMIPLDAVKLRLELPSSPVHRELSTGQKAKNQTENGECNPAHRTSAVQACPSP